MLVKLMLQLFAKLKGKSFILLSVLKSDILAFPNSQRTLVKINILLKRLSLFS